MAFWEWISRLREKCASARRSRGSIRSPPKKSERPENRSCSSYAVFQAYLMIGVTGLGYLALTWSTVVLLGGFVTALGKKEFWCLTTVSMLQAAWIFNDLEDGLFVNFDQVSLIIYQNVKPPPFLEGPFLEAIWKVVTIGSGLILWFVYGNGSVVCLALSSWRLVQRDYGSTDGDSNKANLVPALDLFYSMVVCQSVLLFIWFCFNREQFLTNYLHRECKFPEKWGQESARGYLSDTRAKCWKNHASVRGREVINYAVDMLDSEPQKDYLMGTRMIDNFIKLEADVRSLLLTSRPRIQKLIDTLRWRTADREIRELAARIVAHLAYDIDLTQFPGAIRCISSLLDTTPSNWNNQEGYNKSGQHMKADSSIDGSNGEGWNEMILQGLTIIERLASDQHNCRDICSAPGLLSKIMAPLYSHTLIQDINVSAWAELVNGSLKVVHRLIRAPGWTGRRLRREISSSRQAVSNLEGILDQGNIDDQELQMHAIEILTELGLDLSTNLSRETKENLIKKQMQIFLPVNKEKGETATNPVEIKATAGKTLALLSKTETISGFIMGQRNNIIDDLSKILDSNNKIIYRTIAADILKNLCTHCTLDKEHVKESLLPKVLKEVLIEESQSKSNSPVTSSFQFVKEVRPCKREQRKSATGDDVEKQLSEHSSRNKSSNKANVVQPAMKELQEALLSLTLVICDKLINADDSDDVAPQIALGDAEFLAKLKIIVDKNCQATANCLRIVKLCGQIALLMMSDSQYMPQSEGKDFVESLSKASEIMSNLESCMLFAGTDCGVKNTVRPLLSDLEKHLREKCPRLDRV